jgi:hypothetical protein
VISYSYITNLFSARSESLITSLSALSVYSIQNKSCLAYLNYIITPIKTIISTITVSTYEKFTMKTTKVPIFIALAAKIMFAIAAEVDDTEENPIVNTKLGMLIGSSMRSRLGQTFYAFRGVPYGKCPSGDRKFQVKLQ